MKSMAFQRYTLPGVGRNLWQNPSKIWLPYAENYKFLLPTQPEIFTLKLSKLTASSYRLIKNVEKKTWEGLAYESFTD